ncbi:MAG: DinB family protein [Blastocatellales bacterium]
MKRYMAIALVLIFMIMAATNVLAQQSASAASQNSNPFIGELKQMYIGVKNNLSKMAEKMPEEHYKFKATEDVRTFGQLIGHVADSQARACSAANGEQKSVDAASKTTKADLIAALKESFAICDKAFDSLTDAKAGQMIQVGQRQRSLLGILTGTISHSNEEYGYMAVYMRLKGVVPPSSERR